jgi:hypothetical protein
MGYSQVLAGKPGEDCLLAPSANRTGQIIGAQNRTERLPADSADYTDKVPKGLKSFLSLTEKRSACEQHARSPR